MAWTVPRCRVHVRLLHRQPRFEGRWFDCIGCRTRADALAPDPRQLRLPLRLDARTAAWLRWRVRSIEAERGAPTPEV